MSNGVREEGILDVIRLLAVRGASGKVQVSTGMTEGSLFFNNGQLVDAQVGRLTGFQAINALAAVPDASYNFDPSIEPPVHSSISARERILLKDFFGIEAAEVEPLDIDSHQQHSTPADEDEVTVVKDRPVVAEPPPVHQPDLTVPFRSAPARSTFSPALVLVVVSLLAVMVALAIVFKRRSPDSTASVAPTVETPAPASTSQPPASSPATTSAVADLSGNWSVVNTVEQTSYAAYKNMKVGFNVSINQTGKDFTGTGEKISENGRSLPATSRTPIVVKGTIDGDKIEATFSENGAQRTTNGRFVWRIDKASGGLTGTFNSNAARSSGKSAATKEL